jgi:glutaconyl-CoA decarboxylase
VDEVINFDNMRDYMTAFAESAYQNPLSICPHHHMMIPRIIKG